MVILAGGALALTMLLTWREPLLHKDLEARIMATCGWVFTTAVLLIRIRLSPEQTERMSVAAVFTVVHVLIWLVTLGRPALLMDMLLADGLTRELRRRMRVGQAVFLLGVCALAWTTTSAAP